MTLVGWLFIIYLTWPVWVGVGFIALVIIAIILSDGEE